MRNLWLVIALACALPSSAPVSAARSRPAERPPAPVARAGVLVAMAVCEYSLPPGAPDGQLPTLEPHDCRIAVEHALVSSDLAELKRPFTLQMIRDVAHLLSSATTDE